MHKMTLHIALPLGLAMMLSAQPAMAYVGPGSSLGAVGVVFGLIGTILLSLVSFVWYPIKRLHRKIRQHTQPQLRARIVSRRGQL
ncbi:MAG TPA: hypothetical protein VF475_10040 [Sphingobium sp.]